MRVKRVADIKLPKSTKVKLWNLYLETLGAKKNFIDLARKKLGVSAVDASNYIHSINAYTKYRRRIRKFPRLSAYAKYTNEIWSGDLAYVDKLSAKNKGFNYLFVVIDIFTRFVYVEPLKNKLASSTRDAFMRIILKNGNKKPEKLWVDQGTEFKGVFKKFCETHEINVYSTHSETKAAYAERAIQSLKRIIYKYLEYAWTWTYIEKLQDFVKIMNNRVHSSTMTVPANATDEDFMKVLYAHPRGTKYVRAKNPKFAKGDTVRISGKESVFKKGYLQNFTNELFKICNVTKGHVNTYQLEDAGGQIIEGKFYEQELVLVIKQ